MKLESDVMEKYQNNFYNELLKNKKKKHLAKILNVDEKYLKNTLVIKGEPSTDNFNDELSTK